ncbi:MAG: ribosome recycling factor [Alphaproteobacteria bacterium]|nr:ribosome recycling factor [Alphaproteobacteria bacterium]
MTAGDIADLRRRMQGAVDALRKELVGLRTGRASATLLEPVMVEAYAGEMPLSQLGTIAVADPRLLTVQVWDKSLVKAVERAIRNANLGLNPQADGSLVRVPIPEPSQERRQEMSKVAHRYAEQARVAARNVRRDGMEALKRQEKAKEITQDEHKTRGEEVQKLTDSTVRQIDELLAAKEKDILHV